MQNSGRAAPPSSRAAQLFHGSGELARLCRTKNWSETPLGPVESWPLCLQTTASIVVASTFPMIILWGDEYIQIYNDAYRLIMGDKHPSGLGQPSFACWPEVTEIVAPLYARVMQGEVLSLHEEPFLLAPLGTLEYHYLTICYSPIINEHGVPGGIHVTVFDQTQERHIRIERDQALAEAQLERQRMYDVFTQVPAAIAVLEGPHHTFTVTNPGYQELIGQRDVIGMPVREALPELNEQAFFSLLDQVLITGEPFVARDMGVYIDHNNDGVSELLYIDFVYQPLKNSLGDVFGILVLAFDVTDKVSARHELESQAAELARLTVALMHTNRELDQFAYAASHDLKAPLRGIANLASWIEEDLGEYAEPDVRTNLGLLRSRVSRMEALINGILDYSRAGRVRSDPEPLDTGQLVREITDLLAPQPGELVTVAPEMPTLLAERAPLQQVLMNLISNALKYSRAARADVVVQVDAIDHGDAIEFVVADNGPGIDPDYHERVWGLFQSLESHDKVEGSGIGLAVVKKIIEARGGTVRIISTPGNGALFSVLWPKIKEKA